MFLSVWRWKQVSALYGQDNGLKVALHKNRMGSLTMHRGTVRSQLELVIELLEKGCSWPREHRQIVCTCVPHESRRGGPLATSLYFFS